MNVLKFVLVIALTLCGCASTTTTNYDINIRDWKDSNPTHYDFDIKLAELKEKTLEIVSITEQIANPIPLDFDNSFKKQHLLSYETSDNANFFKEVFTDPQNTQDIVLNIFRDQFWFSNVYVVENKSAKSTGAFHIHFDRLGSDRTRMSVKVIDLQVINGLECCGSHGRYSRYTTVKPTTIEEYIVLSHVAKQLGIAMPDVKLPED